MYFGYQFPLPRPLWRIPLNLSDDAFVVFPRSVTSHSSLNNHDLFQHLGIILNPIDKRPNPDPLVLEPADQDEAGASEPVHVGHRLAEHVG